MPSRSARATTWSSATTPPVPFLNGASFIGSPLSFTGLLGVLRLADSAVEPRVLDEAGVPVQVPAHDPAVDHPDAHRLGGVEVSPVLGHTAMGGAEDDGILAVDEDLLHVAPGLSRHARGLEHPEELGNFAAMRPAPCPRQHGA